MRQTGVSSCRSARERFKASKFVPVATNVSNTTTNQFKRYFTQHNNDDLIHPHV